MDTEAPPGYVAPNPRIPKVFGILNIVFASGLLLWGTCMSFYIVMLPALGRMVEEVQKQAQASYEAQQAKIREALDAKEKAATTEEEKAEVESERKEIESRPKPVMPLTMDFKKMGMNDPQLLGFMWTEILTGLSLNVLLLASGIGLVQLKPWGRKLAIWISGLKIGRLALLYGFAVLFIVPHASIRMARFAAEMVQQQPMGGKPLPGNATEVLARIYSVTYTVGAIGMILFGSIYPGVMAWLLSRPGASAACSRAKPPQRDGETW